MKRLPFFMIIACFLLAITNTVIADNLVGNFQTIQILTSDSTCSIQGSVVDFSTNKPITNATVEIVAPGKTVQTNSSGSFEIDGIQKGTYAVKVTADGYREYDNTFKITPESDSVTIKLTPTGQQQ